MLMCLSPCSLGNDLTAAPLPTGTLLGSSQSSVPRLTPQKSSCPSILRCFPESSEVLPPACLNSPSPMCVVKRGVDVWFSQAAPWLLAPQLFEAGCAPAEHRSAASPYPFPPQPSCRGASSPSPSPAVLFLLFPPPQRGPCSQPQAVVLPCLRPG